MFSHVQPLSCAFPDVLQILSLGLLWVVRASCSPQRHLGQHSSSWHSSPLPSPTVPALALPAQGAQRSRFLRPVGLSLYFHCLASGHCHPDTLACRALDLFLPISSSHTALFPAPFSASLLCSLSPTSPCQPKKPKTLPAVGLVLPCRVSCWLPRAQMKPMCEGELERALA